MKYYILFFVYFFSYISLGNTKNKEINSLNFINDGNENLETIFIESNQTKKNVELLFNLDRLDHEFTKAFNLDAKFTDYWNKNKFNWHFIDLNNDGVFELIFSANPSGKNDEYSSIEVYVFKKNKSIPFLIYKESGALFAFKVHPNTNEIILFQHRFPCCSSFSHNINMIRIVNNKIILRKKYFVINKTGENEIFYPKSFHYDSRYHYLNRNEILRWSCGEKSKNLKGNFLENIIAIYPENSPYKIIYSTTNWKYVLMYAPPMKSKKIKTLITKENFLDVRVFGWIKK